MTDVERQVQHCSGSIEKWASEFILNFKQIKTVGIQQYLLLFSRRLIFHIKMIISKCMKVLNCVNAVTFKYYDLKI